MSNDGFIKILFLSVLMACFIAESAFAGAWTRGKGGWYHQVTGNYYTADESFNNDGDKVNFGDNGEFTDKNVSYYLEYGLLDNLTATGSWSYKWLESENDYIINETNGLSDLEVGLKYQLFPTGSGGICSFQTLVKIPEAYDEDEAVPLGNSQYDYEFRLLYGQSLYPHIPGYFNTEAGYRFRAEAPADELKYLVEFGVDFTKQVYGRVKLDGTLGMDNADDISAMSNNPTASYDYDLGKLDVALGWKLLKEWGMELGYRPEIYGKNTAAGVNWSLSLIYQLE